MSTLPIHTNIMLREVNMCAHTDTRLVFGQQDKARTCRMNRMRITEYSGYIFSGFHGENYSDYSVLGFDTAR